jgi:hypothetical protein
MKITRLITILLIGLLSACNTKITTPEVKTYGNYRANKSELNVSIQLSEFSNYSELLERIRNTVCNDSIPVIILNAKNIERRVFINESCIPLPFNPKGKHYIEIAFDKIFNPWTHKTIKTDSLTQIIQNQLKYEKENGFNSYFVAFQLRPDEKLNTLEKFLNNLLESFDTLNSDKTLNVALWEVYPPPPNPNIY